MRTFLPGGLAVWLGPLVLLAISAAILYSNWDRLPDRFPCIGESMDRIDGSRLLLQT